MNFRRSKPRDTGARSRSSDWRYPVTETSSEKRSTYANKRRAISATEKILDYILVLPENDCE